jgi:hypothetical protein
LTHRENSANTIGVTIQRLALALSIATGIVTMLALPISQLRIVTIVEKCCCPDRTTCHCPKEKPDHNEQPQIKACHSSSELSVTPEPAPLVAPDAFEVASPSRVVAMMERFPSAPRPSPYLPRPAAPSERAD